ncbi:hypothetical protein PGT21_008474 [Puccinia graminis f. sp. tritici]|uniref:Uncharacterized protein n=1 Tax=Puccinia graminis f. sp. tritici TaxID=56615 RepID=A0A5B0QZY5_PUCGR|nr:hypothetical protein PGT21_008474 [Puccinia graminis f. sp. tritici]
MFPMTNWSLYLTKVLLILCFLRNQVAYAKQNSNNKGDYYCELEPKKDVQFCCKPGVIEGFPPTAYPNFVDAGCTHITN